MREITVTSTQKSPIDLSVVGSLTVNDAGADKDSRFEGDTDANLVYVDAGNDRVGVGLAAPLAKLHVHTAASGASPVATADELVVESDLSPGISLLAPNTGQGVIAFGDSDDGDSGRIVYDHTADSLAFRVGNADRVTLELDGSESQLHLTDTAIKFRERSAPDAVANTAIMWAEDNGAGKTRLMVQFPTGAAVQLAIEA
jgi:hypothetical protein